MFHNNFKTNIFHKSFTKTNKILILGIFTLNYNFLNIKTKIYMNINKHMRRWFSNLYSFIPKTTSGLSPK